MVHRVQARAVESIAIDPSRRQEMSAPHREMLNSGSTELKSGISEAWPFAKRLIPRLTICRVRREGNGGRAEPLSDAPQRSSQRLACETNAERVQERVVAEQLFMLLMIRGSTSPPIPPAVPDMQVNVGGHFVRFDELLADSANLG